MKIMMLLQDVHRDNLSRKQLQIRELGSQSNNDEAQATDVTRRSDAGVADDVTIDDDTQYESFVYWKPVLPDIGRELEKLCDLASNVNISAEEAAPEEESNDEDQEQQEQELDDFNEFNYWRLPIQALSLEARF